MGLTPSSPPFFFLGSTRYIVHVMLSTWAITTAYLILIVNSSASSAFVIPTTASRINAWKDCAIGAIGACVPPKRAYWMEYQSLDKVFNLGSRLHASASTVLTTKLAQQHRHSRFCLLLAPNNNNNNNFDSNRHQTNDSNKSGNKVGEDSFFPPRTEVKPASTKNSESVDPLYHKVVKSSQAAQATATALQQQKHVARQNDVQRLLLQQQQQQRTLESHGYKRFTPIRQQSITSKDHGELGTNHPQNNRGHAKKAKKQKRRRKKRMELSWCNEMECRSTAIREHVIPPENYISFDGPATGQVVYTWVYDDDEEEYAGDEENIINNLCEGPTNQIQQALGSVLLLVKRNDEDLLSRAAEVVSQMTKEHIRVLLSPELSAKLKHYYGVDDDQYVKLWEPQPVSGFGSLGYSRGGRRRGNDGGGDGRKTGQSRIHDDRKTKLESHLTSSRSLSTSPYSSSSLPEEQRRTTRVDKDLKTGNQPNDTKGTWAGRVREISPTTAQKKNNAELSLSPDLIVTLGGDGLLMHASSLFPGPVPPILCVAGGSLGFLTPFAKGEIMSAVRRSLGLIYKEESVHQKDMTPASSSPNMVGGLESSVFAIHGIQQQAPPSQQQHEQQQLQLQPEDRFVFGANNRICLSMRMRLDCRIFNPEGIVRARYNVLNEVVIDRGSSPYLANLECFCDDVHLTTVQADGIIFSTPTGSTAYSMAAGGSVVHPAVPAILVTPICPHVLSFRSMVFPDHVVLRCYVPDNARAIAYVAFDGKHRRELNRGDSVQVQMSIHPVPTINRVDQTFDWLNSLKGIFNFNSRAPQRPM